MTANSDSSFHILCFPACIDGSGLTILLASWYQCCDHSGLIVIWLVIEVGGTGGFEHWGFLGHWGQ
jgi:hypothetical protein